MELFQRTDLVKKTEKHVEKQDFWRNKAQKHTASDVLTLLYKSTAIERGRIKDFFNHCNRLVLNMIHWEAMLEFRKRLKFTAKQGM